VDVNKNIMRKSKENIRFIYHVQINVSIIECPFLEQSHVSREYKYDYTVQTCEQEMIRPLPALLR
jgi:hypothetical protein